MAQEIDGAIKDYVNTQTWAYRRLLKSFAGNVDVNSLNLSNLSLCVENASSHGGLMPFNEEDFQDLRLALKELTKLPKKALKYGRPPLSVFNLFMAYTLIRSSPYLPNEAKERELIAIGNGLKDSLTHMTEIIGLIQYVRMQTQVDIDRCSENS